MMQVVSTTAERTALSCPHCGKTFLPQSGRQRFCNITCRRAYQATEIPTPTTCQCCGSPLPPPSANTRKRQIYCSNACVKRALYHRKRGHALFNAADATQTLDRPALPPLPPCLTAPTRQLLELFYARYHTEIPLTHTEIQDAGLLIPLSRLIISNIVRVVPTEYQVLEPSYDLEATGIERLAEWSTYGA